MPNVAVNGIELSYDIVGSGPPLVLVHGSSVDRTTWGAIVPDLSEKFRVLTYDRRGYGRSGSDAGGARIEKDVSDLAGLIGATGFAPCHLVGSSFGALIALRLAAQSPELVRSLAVHEPPLLFSLVEDLEQLPVVEELLRVGGEILEQVERGDLPGGARRFVDELALGSGGWKSLTEEQREVFARNIRCWLEERAQPSAYDLDRGALSAFPGPVLISEGGRSPKHLKRITEKFHEETLPNARYELVEGWGHAPHLTHPAEYAALIRDFAAA
ncbi:MAG TPA: alpha/beta hydrolase [Thermoanaerobaculia bacterium]|nr:alpha/beta hydrolase [Thermoanaerobaculia bacterium]